MKLSLAPPAELALKLSNLRQSAVMFLQVVTLQQELALRNCTKIHVRAHAHKHAASHVASPNNVRLMAVNAARHRETEIQTGRKLQRDGPRDGRKDGLATAGGSEGAATLHQRPRVLKEGCVFNSRSASLSLLLRLFPASLFLHLPSPLLFSVTKGLAGRQADVSRGCGESGRRGAEGR